MCISPKYRVVRLIEQLAFRRSRYVEAQSRVFSRSMKHAQYATAIGELDWIIAQIREEAGLRSGLKKRAVG